MHPGKPDLLHPLTLRVRLLLPERGGELRAPLVDGDRVVRIVYEGAELHIVELPSLVQEVEPGGWEPGDPDRDPERTHRVPHADEFDAHLPRERLPEELRFHSGGMRGVVSTAIQVVGVDDFVPVLGPQDATVPDEAGGASRGVGTSAE